MIDASAVSCTVHGVSSRQRQIRQMLTAKPILCPCVRHEIQEELADSDTRDWLYWSAVQTVPLTPPIADITVTMNALERRDER